MGLIRDRKAVAKISAVTLGILLAFVLVYFASGFVGADVVEPSCPFQPQEGRVIIDLTSQNKLCSYDLPGSDCFNSTNMMGTSLPAGNYDISLYAYDDARGDQSQPHEQYKILFYNSTGYNIANSSSTTDLIDNNAFADWYGEVDSSLLLEDDVTNVKGFHSYYFDNSDTANSVFAGCVAFDSIPEPECTVDEECEGFGNQCSDWQCVDNQCVDNFEDNEGPIISDLTINKVTNLCVTKNTWELQVNATATDQCSDIEEAEYFVGGNGCGVKGTGTLLDTSDGFYDSLVEEVYGNFEASDGSVNVYVRAKDTAENWGECEWVNIAIDCIPPEYPKCEQGDAEDGIALNDECNPYEQLVCGNNPILTANICDSESNIQLAEYFLDDMPLGNWHGINMTAVDGTFLDDRCEDVNATINLTGLEDGTHYVELHAKDDDENWGKLGDPNPRVSFIKDTTAPNTTKRIDFADNKYVDCSKDITSANGNDLTNGCYYVKPGTEITLSAFDFNPDNDYNNGWNNLSGEYAGYKNGVIIYYNISYSDDCTGESPTWRTLVSTTAGSLNENVTINLGEDSCHLIEYWAVDGFCGNEEEHHFELDIVDSKAPEFTKQLIGINISAENTEACEEGDYNFGCYYINQSTLVNVTAVDSQPHPVGGVEVWCEWNVLAENSGAARKPFLVTEPFRFEGDSEHHLHCWANDSLGNTADLRELDFVDSQPPVINKTIIGPQWGTCPPRPNSDDKCFLDGITNISVNVTDPNPHPVDGVTCDWDYVVLDEENQEIVDGEGATGITESPFIVHFPEESHHVLTINCSDALGNQVWDVEHFYVDKTPPLTTKYYGSPYFSDGIGTLINSTLLSYTNFEGFSLNQSIDNQGLWSSDGNWDEEIVDDGTGNKVWRVSNAVTSGSFGNMPFTPRLGGIPTSPAIVPADSVNNNPQFFAGESSTTANHNGFLANFSFKSATGAPQPGARITVSADNGQGGRQSYIAIEDTGTGLRVITYDINKTDGNFVGPITISDNLSYTEWHTTTVEIKFVDGPANDVVNYYVEGILVHTDTTWEEFYRDDPDNEGQDTLNPFGVPVQSLLFRLSGTATGSPGNGFYIDNVTTKTQDISVESTYWINNETDITLSATDSIGPHDTGVNKTLYRITKVDDENCWDQNICQVAEGEGNWETYDDEPFTINEESCHLIEYYSVDNVNKTEKVKKQCAFVDLSAPETDKVLGTPKLLCEDGQGKCGPETAWTPYYVTSDTNITLSCEDQLPHPVEQEKLCYKVSWHGTDYNSQEYDDYTYKYGEPNTEDGYICVDVNSTTKEYNFNFKEDSLHNLEWYCEDALGNRGELNVEYDNVDNQPPEIFIVNPTPDFANNVTMCMQSVVVKVTDEKSGVNESSLHAELINSTGDVVRDVKLNKTIVGSTTTYQAPMDKELPFGEYQLVIYASDNLGNEINVSRTEYLSDSLFAFVANNTCTDLDVSNGGDCEIQFNVCMRGGNSIKFWMDKSFAGTISPELMNAFIENEGQTSLVGLKEHLSGLSQSECEKGAPEAQWINGECWFTSDPEYNETLPLSCEEINGGATFTLHLDLTSNITSLLGTGVHETEYWINSTVDENSPLCIEEAPCIDINTADITELQQLEGIGAGLAQNIIDYREGEDGPFDSLEELDEVSGIGPGIISDIEEQGLVCEIVVA